MKIILYIFISLVSLSLFPSNVEFLDDLLPSAYRGSLEFSCAEAKFDDSLDLLGYMDNLKGSKPKKQRLRIIQFPINLKMV